MDELTRIKFPGKPLTNDELQELADITVKDRNDAIAAASRELKEYLEAKRGRSIRSQQ
jgi:hypothetical protein